jgi:hypothetical protein
MMHPFFGLEIAADIMALTLKAACYIYTVRTVLNGLEKVYYINSSGARHLDCLNIAGIRESHGTCQVRSGVCSVLTAKS